MRLRSLHTRRLLMPRTDVNRCLRILAPWAKFAESANLAGPGGWLTSHRASENCGTRNSEVGRGNVALGQGEPEN